VPTQTLELDTDRRVSLRHLTTHLGSHDIYAVVPDTLDGSLGGLPRKDFAAGFFTGLRSYSKLLLSDDFYAAFADYDFVLIYQLDCLVFSDALVAWCDRGYDYVGAPWTRRDSEGRPLFTGVGNGGLSLRRIDACRRVLAAARRPSARLRSSAALARALAVRAASRARQGPCAVRASLSTPFLFEDKFWSLEAPGIDPSFRIPPPEVAVGFAFETEPRFCFEANGGRLPFGCHRWASYDRAFWEPYLLE
jgi:hypothetical protein